MLIIEDGTWPEGFLDKTKASRNSAKCQREVLVRVDVAKLRVVRGDCQGMLSCRASLCEVPMWEHEPPCKSESKAAHMSIRSAH